MVLSPPAPTRRRGSLRASDVPSGSTSHSSSMSTESGAAAEAMRAVAARLEKHTGVLRSVLEKVSFLDDPASAACKPSPAVAAKKALEAGRRVSSSCESSSSDDDDEFEQAQAARLQSYQRADVYIKKAAGKIAGHRGWTTQNSGDSKRSITEALEELKLASMVLQRRHDADAAGGGIVWKQKRSRIKPNSSDVASSSPRHTDVVSTQQNVTRTHQVVMQRVKDALKPLELTTEALQKTAGRLCADADKCETFDLSLKKKIDELKKQRNDAMAEAAREKTLRETAPAKIVKVLVGPTETEKRADLRKQKEALEKEKAEKKQKESASVLETEKENSQNSAETKPNPDAELMAKLRVATEQRDDFAQKLRRVTITCDTETHALSASVRDAARRTQEAMDKARAAHEEKERWRALYVAVRSDFAGGVGKVEADALRAATRKSEDTRRRELSLLGAEHGNQCASLKRALADAERRVNEMVPQLEKAERKQKEASESLENEKNATETAEHKARLMHGELKRCAQKLEVLELDLASTQLKLEQTERHSLELQKHETVARLAITKELETERLANSKHDDWRVRAAEAKFLAAASTAKREKDRADTAEQLLDEERRAVVDQHAVVAGNAMADASVSPCKVPSGDSRQVWRAPSVPDTMGVSTHDPYGPVGSPSSFGRSRPADITHAHHNDLQSSSDDMSAMADLVSLQMRALKDILDRSTSAGSASETAMRARHEHETEWWDSTEQTSDGKLISYRKTDDYIKRAASRASAQRKFVTNKNAASSLQEACEDLKLASSVLKQQHETETAAAEHSARRVKKLTESVKAEHAAMKLFRDEMGPAVETVVRGMADLKDNLDRAAVAAARRANETLQVAPEVSPQRIMKSPVLAMPRIDAFETEHIAGFESPPSVGSLSLPSTPPVVTKIVEKIVTDPNLVEELRLARMRIAELGTADDLVDELRAATRRSKEEQDAMFLEMTSLRQRHAASAAEVSRLTADSEKWRAMFDAVKDERGRGESVFGELDATRAALRRADETHAREIATLGAEHGAADADAKRALAASDRRVADLEPTLEACEKRIRSLEEDVRGERERRRDVEGELRRVSGDLQRAGRDVSLTQDERTKELELVTTQLERVTRRAADERDTLEKALDAARKSAGAGHVNSDDGGANGVSSSGWRLANSENELRKAQESLTSEREETGRLRGELERAQTQLNVARETSQRAARSDLPGVVAALEAEVKRLAKTHAAEIANSAEVWEVETKRVHNKHASELRHQKDVGEVETRRAEMLGKSARAETDGAKAEVGRLELERLAMQNELKRLESEVKRLRSELRHAEEVLMEESKKTTAASALAAAEIAAATAAMTAAAAKERGNDESAEIARLKNIAEKNAKSFALVTDELAEVTKQLTVSQRSVHVTETAKEQAEAQLRAAQKKTVDALEAETAMAATKNRKAVEVLEARAATALVAHKRTVVALEEEASLAATTAARLHKNAIAALDAEALVSASEYKKTLTQLDIDFAEKHKGALAAAEVESDKATVAHRALLESTEAELVELASKHKKELADLRAELNLVQGEASRRAQKLQALGAAGEDDKADKTRLAADVTRLRAALLETESALEASNARVLAAEQGRDASNEKSSVSEEGGNLAASEARAKAAEEALAESTTKVRGLKTEFSESEQALDTTKMKLATLRWRLLGGSRGGGDEQTVAPPPPAQTANAIDPETLRLIRQEICDKDDTMDALSRTVTRLEACLGAEIETSQKRVVALEDSLSELTILRRDCSDSDKRAAAANKRAETSSETSAFLEKELSLAQKQAEEALRKAEEAAARQKNAEEAAIRLNQKLVEFVAVAAETKPSSAVQSSVLSTQHTSTDRELTEKLTQELNEAKAQLKKLRRAVFDADEKALALKKKLDAALGESAAALMERGAFKKQAEEFEAKARDAQNEAEKKLRDAQAEAEEFEKKLRDAQTDAEEFKKRFRDARADAETATESSRDTRTANRLLARFSDSDSETKKILETAEYEIQKAHRDKEDADARAASASARAEDAISRSHALTLEAATRERERDACVAKISVLETKITKLEKPEKPDVKPETNPFRHKAEAVEDNAKQPPSVADATKIVTVYPVASTQSPEFKRVEIPSTENVKSHATAAAGLYREDYKILAENVSVLSLLCQHAYLDQAWLSGTRGDALRCGQQPNPMARAAGKLMVKLTYPRTVCATWWEYLLLLCAAWVCCILAFCYVSETVLSITPGILFAPFFPSFCVLLARIVLTTDLDFKNDRAKSVINTAHLALIPIGFMLFFAKLWYDADGLPWWLVYLFPFITLTKFLGNFVHDVVILMPMTEYAALGFGEENSAYEFAFSERKSGEREIDMRTRRVKDVPYVATRTWETRGRGRFANASSSVVSDEEEDGGGFTDDVIRAGSDGEDVERGVDTAGVVTAGVDTAGDDTARVNTARVDTRGVVDTAGVDSRGGVGTPMGAIAQTTQRPSMASIGALLAYKSPRLTKPAPAQPAQPRGPAPPSVPPQPRVADYSHVTASHVALTAPRVPGFGELPKPPPPVGAAPVARAVPTAGGSPLFPQRQAAARPSGSNLHADIPSKKKQPGSSPVMRGANFGAGAFKR